MGQHQELGTWEITELPPGQMAISCQWVYAVKTKPDGKFEKAKARIVAQGFTQRPGMDYYDIMSPIVKFNSLRVLVVDFPYISLYMHPIRPHLWSPIVKTSLLTTTCC